MGGGEKRRRRGIGGQVNGVCAIVSFFLFRRSVALPNPLNPKKTEKVKTNAFSSRSPLSLVIYLVIATALRLPVPTQESVRVCLSNNCESTWILHSTACMHARWGRAVNRDALSLTHARPPFPITSPAIFCHATPGRHPKSLGPYLLISTTTGTDEPECFACLRVRGCANIKLGNNPCIPSFMRATWRRWVFFWSKTQSAWPPGYS